VLITICGVSVSEVLPARLHRAREQGVVSYPYVLDLGYAVLSAIGIACVRAVLTWMFIPVGDYFLPQNKWTESERVLRVQRFGTVSFKFIYFTVMTCMGWWLMRNEQWNPRALYGTGRIELCWADMPYQSNSTWMYCYMLTELGYHLQSLMFRVYKQRHRNDFLEMALHHSTTVMLISFSFVMNYLRIGTLLLFVHNLVDINIYAIKTTVDTEYIKATVFIYVSLLISYAYYRLYVIPFVILRACVVWMKVMIDPADLDVMGQYGLIGMLSILVIVEVYWFILFLFMGHHYLLTGNTCDTQEQITTSPVKAEQTRAKTTPHKFTPNILHTPDTRDTPIATDAAATLGIDSTTDTLDIDDKKSAAANDATDRNNSKDESTDDHTTAHVRANVDNEATKPRRRRKPRRHIRAAFLTDNFCLL